MTHGILEGDGKIYADVSQPATLIDGDRQIECETLGEAVVALDNLPDDRQSVAMIKVGDRVFTAAEVDRLHHRKTV
jgi:hypothetical protein